MNEVMENLLTRRSIRSYQPDMIPMETIEEIVKAALTQPPAWAQSPIIIAVTDKETRDQLSLQNAAVMGSSADLFMAPPWSSSFLRIKTGERIFTMAAWSWEI